MARKTLTDRKVQSLKAAKKGKRYQVMDGLVPGFGVRVTDTGLRTYIMQARFPGQANPVRRELGKVGVLTLEEAREKARAWTVQIKRGLDPSIVEAREREQNAQRRANTFGAVFEDYVASKLGALKSGDKIEHDMRANLLDHFKDKPITEITDVDILTQVVNPRLRSGRSMGRYLLDLLKMFFNWVVEQRGTYGLKISPAYGLKTAKIFGKAKRRQRILNDTEMRALWIAANRLPYPTGPVYRTLILTALRLKEAMNTNRPEWDLRGGEWIIPAERMKGGLAHAVPIIEELREIAGFFPNGGPFLFSNTSGEKPMGPGRPKQYIDEEMLKVLKEIAVENGDDPAQVKLAPWRTHDIRRTVRSKLSKLRVQHEVKEAILAHAKPGIVGIYDVYEYFDEKREALELWAAELRRIAEPAQDNVVPMRRERVEALRAGSASR